MGELDLVAELVTQTYLRSGGTLKGLEDTYSITSKRHRLHPNLVLLKYDQIESPFHHELVRECRGLILDENNKWQAISLAFTKFFNHGELNAAQIDWATARVQEKLDGSLCVLYPYKNNWEVATSGSPDASGSVGDSDITFRDLFWKTFNSQIKWLPSPEGKYSNLIFAFELTTPLNRVIIPHSDYRLTLIGVRDMFSLKELDPRMFPWPTVREFKLQSFTDIELTFSTMRPLEQEGYVVVDANFNRVKVKHPGYVAIHHLKDRLSIRRVLDIIRTNEEPEFLTYFPEWRPEFDKIRASFNMLVEELTRDYEAISHIPRGTKEDQKLFAATAVKSKCSGALFQLRAGTTSSIKQYLAEMNIENLMRVLKLQEPTSDLGTNGNHGSSSTQ
jgi:hypothetical protein